jgi:FtsP/CotA-like multicopper oxidase with cupredoxin domain
MEPTKNSDGLSIFTIVVSLLGVCVAVAALIVATGINDGGAASASAGASQVEVSLTEFAIDPDPIVVGPGGTLAVANDGTMVHNLAVKDGDLTTPDLASGDSASLALDGLAPGDHTVICTVPGHEASGMTATLSVSEGEAVASDDHADHSTMSFEEMDEVMAARTALFPAKTAGTGATELQPTIGADGAKEFELTASVFDWELEPGNVVQAWGYNEQVPGPTIRTEVGDTVRITVHNELEESTVLHSHGFTLPNAMDGVPDITQAPIEPGDSFTYEFVVKEPMVGMYHSHHNAQIQVPNGMLGAFYAGDMPLPAGTPPPAVDIPMVLNDAGVIGLSLNGKSFPATAPIVAKVGDWIKLDYMNEGMQVHPMHLHGMPQLVIAKDGYPLANPSMEDTVTVAPGERVSVLVHATEPGAWAWHCHILNHAEREDGMFGMVTALVVE